MSIKVCYGHYGQYTILFAERFVAEINIHFMFQKFIDFLDYLSKKLFLYLTFKLSKRAHFELSHGRHFA